MTTLTPSRQRSGLASSPRRESRPPRRREPDGHDQPAPMTSDSLAEEFAELRPRLLGIAYRMLGSAWDAEDVVADAMVRWMHVDRTEIREPLAYLTTVVTRLAIDQLRSARATRGDLRGGVVARAHRDRPVPTGPAGHRRAPGDRLVRDPAHDGGADATRAGRARAARSVRPDPRRDRRHHRHQRGRGPPAPPSCPWPPPPRCPALGDRGPRRVPGPVPRRPRERRPRPGAGPPGR